MDKPIYLVRITNKEPYYAHKKHEVIEPHKGGLDYAKRVANDFRNHEGVEKVEILKAKKIEY